ncbi:putative gamma-glutamyl cyclotransferase-like protein [Bacillus phage PBC5]|nr:putative gamma-glutamyl cyclotransferase-like protein [Bacillus phage PBC5]
MKNTNDSLQAVVEENTNYPFFVYGTLRNGHGNYNRLLKGKTIAELDATITGTLHAVSPFGGFPCYIEEGVTTIKGEVMHVPFLEYDQRLKELDGLEGYREEAPQHSMYLRKLMWVTLESGHKIKAWVYVWNGTCVGRPIIHNGDWAKYEPQRHVQYQRPQYAPPRYEDNLNPVPFEPTEEEMKGFTNCDNCFELIENCGCNCCECGERREKCNCEDGE